MKKTSQNGFTLAEVLITLGVIGIVAILTIPTLMQKTQDYQFKQAWKKEYSAISQAFNLVKQDEGGDLSQYFITASNNQTAYVEQKLGNYLAYTKSCAIPYTVDYYYVCGSNPSINMSTNMPYKTLSGSGVNVTYLIQGQYILNDGAQLYFRIYDPNRLYIFVDVNGPNKGPNIQGKDFFGILATNDWIKPMGAAGTGAENTCSTTGIGCSSEYLYN
jgi:prepilin-type N-terminal cleavage/methylation domain-containing protein